MKTIERTFINWQEVVETIMECNRRWNDRTIASAIGLSGHMSIFKIRHGMTVDPHYSVGEALLKLQKHEQRAARKRHSENT